MKLVQMPVELLHLEQHELLALGVDERLLAQLEGALARTTGDQVGLAILATPGAGTRQLLMVVARRVGAALRNENIRLRDRGGDLQAGRKKLCYLPGSALTDALRSTVARESLEREAACFFQDLDLARATARGSRDSADPAAVVALIDVRLQRKLPTYLSADPGRLPPGLERELRARLRVLEVTRPDRPA